MDVTRPSSKETEAEILCSQREFLSQQSKPSAQIIKRKVQSDNFNVLDNNSSEKTKKQKFQKDEEVDYSPIDNHDMNAAIVLLDIKEREINSGLSQEPSFRIIPEVSFPKPFVLNTVSSFQGKNRKKSIFAQQMEKKQKILNRYELTKDSISQQACSFSNAAKGSCILEGSGLENKEEVTKIHEENISKLENMSKEEILAQQKKLLQQIDPNIVEFLRSKRKPDKVDSMEIKNSLTSGGNVHQLKSDESEKCLMTDDRTFTSNEDMSMDVEIKACKDNNVPMSASGGDVCQWKTDEIKCTITDGRSFISNEDISMDGEIKTCQEETRPFLNNVPKSSDTIEVDMALKLAEENKWLHMNIVEKEKLLWTSELPPPLPIDSKTGYPARFDLKGNLLERDADISIKEGLHHHGEEPEIPGYTIEELFLISRSSFQSQAIIALQTLAAIIQKNQQGLFDNCFESVLMQELLDAGIVPLLRWALDESSESLIFAALLAIRNLICNKYDEICLDYAFSWKDGYIAPFLEPQEVEKDEEETKPEEMTDIEIVKFDVIKGLLRMDILPRLRYILEVCRPEATAVSCIFDILIRIGRHSLEAATRVLECPRLMKIIVSEFLPCSWKFAETIQGKQNNVYGFPLNSAVKLIRVLASAGRHIAARLIANFGVLNPLWSFIATDLSDRRLPFPGFLIVNEALRTWRILLTYGLASHQCRDLFALLVQRLKFCHSLDVNTNSGENDCSFAALLFSIFEAMITVVSSKSPNEMRNESAPLTWNCITDVYGIIEVCLKKWMWQIASDEGTITTASTIMLGSCLNFVSEYYKCSIKMCPTSAVDILEKAKLLGSKFLLPVLKSSHYRKLLLNLSSYSNLLCEQTAGSKRNAPTLPFLGCIMWASDVIPIVKENTPFPLLISISNLIFVIEGICHDTKDVATELITARTLTRYVDKLVEAKRLNATQWHSRFEIRFLYILASLSSCVHPHPIYYKLSLQLLSGISYGEEHLGAALMNTVAFNYEFLREYDEVDQKLQHLQINDTILVKSATGESLEINDRELLSRTCQQLSSICSMYIDTCFKKEALERSRWLIERSSSKINSISVKAFENPVLTREWPYYPIKQVYKKAKSANLQQNSSSEEVIMTVIKCLQCIHLLEVWECGLIKRIPTAVRFCNLSIMFLIGSDAFLYSDVRKYCQSILHELLRKTKNKKWKLEVMSSPGVTTFSDVYTELLIQFEAVSYGDHLFGNVVAIPLQQYYDSYWKKQLFGEHSGILRTLNVPLNELLVPLDMYLYPPERDELLLHSYARSLLSGQLRATWCPLLHKMAVHHLRCHLMKIVDTQQQFDVLLELLKFVKVDERKKQMAKNLLNSIMS